MVSKRKVAAIIQARTDSERLPGKVLLKLPFDGKETIVGQTVNRLKKCPHISQIILATSEHENDDSLEFIGRELNITVFRGSKKNVLSRFCEAAKQNNVDDIIRLTGDNPLVLLSVLCDNLEIHRNENVDYTRNIGLPYGMSFEIIKTQALLRAFNSTKNDSDLEHVTTFIKRFPDMFEIREVHHELSPILKDLRFTIDYPSDYAFMNILFQYLRNKKYEYDLFDVESFIGNNIWLQDINSKNIQKVV